MGYIIATQQECEAVASRMNEFFGLPNTDKRTLRVSDVEAIPGKSEFCVCIPEEYVSELTTSEMDKLSSNRPEELNKL